MLDKITMVKFRHTDGRQRATENHKESKRSSPSRRNTPQTPRSMVTCLRSLANHKNARRLAFTFRFDVATETYSYLDKQWIVCNAISLTIVRFKLSSLAAWEFQMN